MSSPTYYDAILELVPNAKAGVNIKGDEIRINWEDEREQPTQKAIQAKLKELKEEYEKQAYARSRAMVYDPIPEQLDQIYHDMDGWKAKIKAVKDKYPKPT